MVKRFVPLFAAVAACAVAQADPQYTVVDLHPPAVFGNSFGIGGRAGQQVGNVSFILDPHNFGQAALWTGSAASAINLNPVGHEGSTAFDTDGNFQVGVTIDSAGGSSVTFSAAMWHGTAASYINMAPPGSTESRILGIDNGIEVGISTVNGAWVPGYWTGASAASWTVLSTPFPGETSQVAGISGNSIVGEVDVQGQQHAFVWSRNTNTYTDLHPANYTDSFLFGTDGVQHVGQASNIVNNNYTYHPGLWDAGTGTFTDLIPAGWNQGHAYDVKNGIQVGDVSNSPTTNISHAALWTGTPGSFFDLSQFLPNTSVFSEANGIDEAGNIIGDYYNGSSWRAVMWVPVVQSPPPFTFLGFFSPLNDPASPESRYKAGRSIPIKFALLNSAGLPVINATATISLDVLNGNTATPIDPSVFAMGADSGAKFRFDAEGDLYIYNLDTKNLAPGHYRVTATIAETGQTHSDTFTLTAAPGRGKN